MLDAAFDPIGSPRESLRKFLEELKGTDTPEAVYKLKIVRFVVPLHTGDVFAQDEVTRTVGKYPGNNNIIGPLFGRLRGMMVLRPLEIDKVTFRKLFPTYRYIGGFRTTYLDVQSTDQARKGADIRLWVVRYGINEEAEAEAEPQPRRLRRIGRDGDH